MVGSELAATAVSTNQRTSGPSCRGATAPGVAPMDSSAAGSATTAASMSATSYALTKFSSSSSMTPSALPSDLNLSGYSISVSGTQQSSSIRVGGGIGGGGGGEKTLWNDACRLGDCVVKYSINEVRERVLKDKIGLLELKQYIFARQMQLSIMEKAPAGKEGKTLVQIAAKGKSFVQGMRVAIEKRIQSLSFAANEAIATEAASVGLSLVGLRIRQAELWAATASVRLVRSLRNVRQSFLGPYVLPEGGGGTNGDSVSASARAAVAAPGREVWASVSGGASMLGVIEGADMSDGTATDLRSGFENADKVSLQEFESVVCDVLMFACSRVHRVSCTLLPSVRIAEKDGACVVSTCYVASVLSHQAL